VHDAAIGWRRAQDVEARPTVEREIRSPMSAFSIRFELDERSRTLREPAERIVDFSISVAASHHALSVSSTK
jgi:hypothetical protein